MPGVRIYGGVQGFENATLSSVVYGKNQAPKDVDSDLVSDHGICAGITMSWVVAYLGGNSDTHDTDTFSNWFGVVRYQGAGIHKGYHKENQKNVKGQVLAYAQAFGLKGIHEVRSEHISPFDLGGRFPADTWAGYISCWGHAVGVNGFRDRIYHIMEPNFGLFKYHSRKAMLTDLGVLLQSRMEAKKQGWDAKVRFHAFTAPWNRVPVNGRARR